MPETPTPTPTPTTTHAALVDLRAARSEACLAICRALLPAALALRDTRIATDEILLLREARTPRVRFTLRDRAAAWINEGPRHGQEESYSDGTLIRVGSAAVEIDLSANTTPEDLGHALTHARDVAAQIVRECEAKAAGEITRLRAEAAAFRAVAART